MSTTVIASKIGWTLWFASWWSASVDEAEVDRVLRAHGLQLLPGSMGGNEFIAGQDLSPAKAAALAQDLRGLGLTVRVVNKTGLTGSRRVGNTFAVAMMGGMVAFPLLLKAFALDPGDAANPAFVAIALPALAVALNGVLLAMRGGASLTLAAAEPEAVDTTPASLVDTLRDQLPEHLVDPLVQQVRELERIAQEDPDGPAAKELAALRDDQVAHRQEEAADKARRLRAELARARRAVSETTGR